MDPTLHLRFPQIGHIQSVLRRHHDVLWSSAQHHSRRVHDRTVLLYAFTCIAPLQDGDKEHGRALPQCDCRGTGSDVGPDVHHLSGRDGPAASTQRTRPEPSGRPQSNSKEAALRPYLPFLLPSLLARTSAELPDLVSHPSIFPIADRVFTWTCSYPVAVRFSRRRRRVRRRKMVQRGRAIRQGMPLGAPMHRRGMQRGKRGRTSG